MPKWEIAQQKKMLKNNIKPIFLKYVHKDFPQNKNFMFDRKYLTEL